MAGRLREKISSNPDDASNQFPPAAFAQEFVGLCMRAAADAGFWHMDIKRANLLWRSDTRPPLELCFTDFDGYFCRILSPGLRADTRHCCIAATAACVLGEIRCKEDKATWAEYAPAVEARWSRLPALILDNIEVQDWCFFLKNVGETRTVVKDGKQTRLTEESLTNEERVLGGRFRNHLFNYFIDPGGRGPC